MPYPSAETLVALSTLSDPVLVYRIHYVSHVRPDYCTYIRLNSESVRVRVLHLGFILLCLCARACLPCCVVARARSSETVRECVGCPSVSLSLACTRLDDGSRYQWAPTNQTGLVSPRDYIAIHDSLDATSYLSKTICIETYMCVCVCHIHIYMWTQVCMYLWTCILWTCRIRSETFV